VPTDAEGLEDYLDIVKQPMDFSTIRGKLDQDGYDHLRFSADVRLVYHNAMRYNFSAEHDCHKAARAGLRSFEAYFGCVLGTSDSLPSASTPGGQRPVLEPPPLRLRCPSSPPPHSLSRASPLLQAGVRQEAADGRRA